MTASKDLSKTEGPYETYAGSPVSQGIFQFDMWSVKPSPRYDWAELRKNIIQYGIRNSLSVAPMPTASTAQILGNKVEMDIAHTLTQNTTLLRLGVHFNTSELRFTKVQSLMSRF